ncbi:unnamed protein product [Merluccius merluccius]
MDSRSKRGGGHTYSLGTNGIRRTDRNGITKSEVHFLKAVNRRRFECEPGACEIEDKSGNLRLPYQGCRY